jgi:hypothetical protein
VADFYHDDPVEFGQSPKRKFSSLLSLIALIAGGAFFIHTTLAANISLNSGAPIEFGQGLTQLTACSGSNSITVTPQSTFVNQSGSGAYYFSSVIVSDIPDSCQGYDFTINAYGITGDSPLALFNSTSASSVVYNNSGIFQLGVGAAGTSVASGTRKFTITFTTPVASSISVGRITIQSSKHTLTCAEGGVCVVKDIGPGGGTVFYVSSTPFTETGAPCGSNCRYLEARVSSGPSAMWSVNYATTQIGASAQGAAIGTGYSNTSSIIAQNGIYNASTNNYAAGGAASYTGGGKTDWFMPSKMELAALVAYESTLSPVDPIYGNTQFFNSSSEFSATNVWGELMHSSGSPASGVGKTDNNHYVSVRAF